MAAMRLRYFLFIILFGTKCAMAQSDDSLIQFRTMETSLSEKSKQTPDNKYYEYLSTKVIAGDIVIIDYTSDDYAVTLGVSDSFGHQRMIQSDTTAGKGKRITFPFMAPATGKYNLLFTSKEPGKTGKFKVSMFYYNSHLKKIAGTSSFCDKLKFVTSMSYVGFEFLKAKLEKGIDGPYFEPSVAIIPQTKIAITHKQGDKYHCVADSSADLKTLKKKFEDLEREMSTCLADHKKKVFTKATIDETERKNFVMKTEFTLPGTYPTDLNAPHALLNIKDKVTLRLDKDGAKSYKLVIDVE
jgi:hypothetical protein